MKRVLSIFAFLLLLGACATADPMRMPQANEYEAPPEGYQPRTYTNGYDHISATIQDFATVDGKSTAPSNAILQVTWDVVPGYSQVTRINCQVHIKNKYELAFTRYPCLDIKRSGRGVVVGFNVNTPTGVEIKEYNLSFIRGGFIQGELYEAPVNSHMNRYRSYDSTPRPVVWSTHID